MTNEQLVDKYYNKIVEDIIVRTSWGNFDYCWNTPYEGLTKDILEQICEKLKTAGFSVSQIHCSLYSYDIFVQWHCFSTNMAHEMYVVAKEQDKKNRQNYIETEIPILKEKLEQASSVIQRLSVEQEKVLLDNGFDIKRMSWGEAKITLKNSNLKIFIIEESGGSYDTEYNQVYAAFVLPQNVTSDQITEEYKKWSTENNIKVKNIFQLHKFVDWIRNVKNLEEADFEVGSYKI